MSSSFPESISNTNQIGSLRFLEENIGDREWPNKLLNWLNSLEVPHQERIVELVMGDPNATLDASKPGTELLLYYLYTLGIANLYEAGEEFQQLSEDEQRNCATAVIGDPNGEIDLENNAHRQAFLQYFNKDGKTPFETIFIKLCNTKLAKPKDSDVLLRNLPTADQMIELVKQSLFGKQTPEENQRGAALAHLQTLLGRFEKIATDSGGTIQFPQDLDTALANARAGRPPIAGNDIDAFDTAVQNFLAAAEKRRVSIQPIGEPPFNGDSIAFLCLCEEYGALDPKERVEKAAATLAHFAVGVKSPDFGHLEPEPANVGRKIVRDLGRIDRRIADLGGRSAKSVLKEFPCFTGIEVDAPAHDIAHHFGEIQGLTLQQLSQLLGYLYNRVPVASSQHAYIGNVCHGISEALAEKFGHTIAEGDLTNAWRSAPAILNTHVRGFLNSAKVDENTRKALRKIPPPAYETKQEGFWDSAKKVASTVVVIAGIVKIYEEISKLLKWKDEKDSGDDRRGHR